MDFAARRLRATRRRRCTSRPRWPRALFWSFALTRAGPTQHIRRRRGAETDDLSSGRLPAPSRQPTWGGDRSLTNLACLCWRHHHLLHEGGWNLTYDPDTDRTIWHAPDGRRLIGQRRATADAHRSTTTAA